MPDCEIPRKIAVSKETKAEKHFWAFAAGVGALLLASLGFFAIRLIDHIGDGDKHETGEQKMNRTIVAITKALDGKVPPQEVKDALNRLGLANSEHSVDIKKLREDQSEESRKLRELISKQELTLARIEALLENRK